MFRPLFSVTANSEAYRTLIGKEIDERMMDRFVAGKVRELEDEVRIKTAERTEIDRKVATQKANLWTERQKVEDKAQELTGEWWRILRTRKPKLVADSLHVRFVERFSPSAERAAGVA